LSLSEALGLELELRNAAYEPPPMRTARPAIRAIQDLAEVGMAMILKAMETAAKALAIHPRAGENAAHAPLFPRRRAADIAFVIGLRQFQGDSAIRRASFERQSYSRS